MQNLILILQNLRALNISPYIVYSTKPLNHLYIVDPLLITLTVLLGSINQIGICDDHNVYSGASCFKEH